MQRLTLSLRVLTPVVAAPGLLFVALSVYFGATDQPQRLILVVRVTMLLIGAFLALWVVTLAMGNAALRRMRTLELVRVFDDTEPAPDWGAGRAAALLALGFRAAGSYETRRRGRRRGDVYLAPETSTVVAEVEHTRRSVVFTTSFPDGAVIATACPIV